MVDWQVIDGPASAKDFARRLGGAPTVTEARTSISALIDYCVPLFADNGFEGSRHVIDVSGDGENNVGRAVTLARDDAVSAGVTINGLPIVREGLLPWDEDRDHRRNLDSYYRDSVIGGPGAFVVVVKDYNGFADAIIAKLLKEIAELSHPEHLEARCRRNRQCRCVLHCVGRNHSKHTGNQIGGQGFKDRSPFF